MRATFWCSAGTATSCGCSTAAAVLAESPIPAISCRRRGGAEIALHYERLPLRPRFRVGDALPLLPTGERHAAMRLTDWLAAQSEPVTLPFMEAKDSAFRFPADGTLNAVLGGGNGSRETAGAWRWSRGELIVTLDGAAAANSYSWRALAAHVGWTAE